jgi:hypothetical protein
LPGNEPSEYVFKILYVVSSLNSNIKRPATSFLGKMKLLFTLHAISVRVIFRTQLILGLVKGENCGARVNTEGLAAEDKEEMKLVTENGRKMGKNSGSERSQ